MANSHKGEVDFEAGGVTYTIRLKSNELAELERLYDCPINDILQWFRDPSRIKLDAMRSILWVALRRMEPRPTIDEVGDIMDEAGFDAVGGAIGEAFALTFPKPETAPANPPKAGRTKRAGTGKPS